MATARTPIAAPSAIVAGMRAVQLRAATAGARSRPTTRSVPTAWKEATTASVTSPTSATCARCGRSPSVSAIRGSNAATTKARWHPIVTARVRAIAAARTTMSAGRMARMSPNRRAVASVAKLRECDTMITPTESIATNSSPMLVSYESLPRRCSAPMAALIATALAAAPSSSGRPSTVASATPGSIPWPMASPRNAMPRMTTHVPTTPQMTATRAPPTSARAKNSALRGSVSQDTGRDSTSK